LNPQIGAPALFGRGRGRRQLGAKRNRCKLHSGRRTEKKQPRLLRVSERSTLTAGQGTRPTDVTSPSKNNFGIGNNFFQYPIREPSDGEPSCAAGVKPKTSPHPRRSCHRRRQGSASCGIKEARLPKSAISSWCDQLREGAATQNRSIQYPAPSYAPCRNGRGVRQENEKRP